MLGEYAMGTPRVLEKAFEEARKLSDEEQEALGAWILDELNAERRWGAAFDGSADALERLANEALAEHRQ